MNKYLIIILLIFQLNTLYSQNDSISSKAQLSLQDVILIAGQHSPDALLARHSFRSSYWEFRSYKAGKLPTLSLEASLPSLNRSLERVIQPDGSEKYIYRKSISNDANISLSQNIGITGGTLSISSGLQRFDQFRDSLTTSYMATPLSITLSQPINKFNSYRWEKKTEPMKFEKGKRSYISSMEDISIKAINLFFALANAQLNNQIAKVNYQNADTLYKLGQGRYKIGIIAEDELLQLELSLINSGIELKKSQLDIIQNKSQLINFLGINKNTDIQLIIPDSVPSLTLNYNQTTELVNKNNPEIISQQLQLIEAEKNLAQQKSAKGLQANLSMSLNLNKSSEYIENVYQNPNDGQVVQLGISIPLVDWGKSKGQYKMAKSNMEVAKVTVEQARLQFEQNIFNEVMQFNFQKEQFLAACKADTIAQMRYFISKQRYMISKISILDLNTALTQRDASRRSYLSSIQSFWTSYYNIRKLTLYDFFDAKDLSADYDGIVK